MIGDIFIVDGFVLGKMNGMSFCLRSILVNIEFDLRRHIVVLVPSKDFVRLVPPGFGVVVLECKNFILWENFVLPKYLKSLAGDVSLFSPANTSPLFLPTKIRRYLLLHDVMFYKFFDFSGVKHFLSHLYYAVNVYFGSSSALKIFTVSNFSKSDIKSVFGGRVPAEKIHVFYEAPRCDFGDYRVEDVKVYGRFFLAPCLGDPRKSSRETFEAFVRYRKQGGLVNLVMFGDEVAWRKINKNCGVCEGSFFLGRVSDKLLASLYRFSNGFFFCSKYEGFGLPVLEAMSCGSPVVTTNTTSLPEVGGSAAHYVDARGLVSGIVEAMFALEDVEYFELLRLRGYKNVKRFDWKRSADFLMAEAGVC